MTTDKIGILGTNQKRGQDYNKLVVFENIRLYGPLSRAEIANRTNLVPQTISNLVKVLIEDGLIVEQNIIEPLAGRRRGAQPTHLVIQEDAKFAIGIQIQYSRVVGTLVNLNGHPIMKLSVDIAEISIKEFKTKLYELIDTLTQLISCEQNFIGIGVGVPSVLNQPRTEILGHQNLPFESTEWLKEELERRYNKNVQIGDNAQMAAVGEYWISKGTIPQSFFYVYIGDNVGGCLMIDGERYVGELGRAIQIGHFQYVSGGHRCYCGANGCLDQYGSPNAIRRDLGITPEKDFATIVEKANSGHQITLETFDKATKAIAETIASSLMMLDLTTCVIGGPHAMQLYDWVYPKLNKLTQQRKLKNQILLSRVGIDAGAIGAAVTMIYDQLWCKPSNLLKK